MFKDEVRFGLMGTPRRCWAPYNTRPVVGARLDRKCIDAFCAVSPHDGVMDSLVLPWVNADPRATRGEYEQVLLAVGQAGQRAGREHSGAPVPFTVLVDAKGAPKPAWDMYKLINAAGVPRQAEVIVFADDVAEAALGYYILRLMGWPDVKVWLRD